MRTSIRSRKRRGFSNARRPAGLRLGWCTIVVLCLGCAGTRPAADSTGAPPTVINAATVPASGSGEPTQQKLDARTPFSGEIVYQRTIVSRTSELPFKALGRFHYFISGAHWKHMDEAGDLSALYDPDANVIHYFKPNRKDVDARQSDGPVRFEPLPETRVILGRTCRGIRQVSAQSTITEFYDPDLFVDPQDYANHHSGHWAEFLRAKQGGLPLWDAMEGDGYSVVSEAVRIVPRTFAPSFWALPDPNDAPRKAE